MLTVVESQSPNDVKIELFIIEEMHRLQRFLNSNEKKVVAAIALRVPGLSLLLLELNDDEDYTIYLRASAAFGRLDILKILIEQTKNVLFTPLLELAAKNGHCEVVNFLLCERKKEIEPHSALCLASENGHLEIVNCMLKIHKVDPNDGEGYVPYKEKNKTSKLYILQRSEALYKAAYAGHIDIVSTLLNDPNTRYFGPDDEVNNSSNEKAFIISLASSINILMNKDIDPNIKRENLLNTAGQLLIRNQQTDFARLFGSIEKIMKEKIFTTCYGKKAPPEMIENKLADFVYGPYHTEIKLLIESKLVMLGDGSLSFVYDKKKGIYSEHYSQQPQDILETEVTHLGKALGYEFTSLDADSLTLSPKSSVALKNTTCIHYNASYMKTLYHMRSFFTKLSPILIMFLDTFGFRMSQDIWNQIGRFFLLLTKGIDINITYIDPSDKVIVTNINFSIPSPSQFLLPNGENGEPRIVEIPTEESISTPWVTFHKLARAEERKQYLINRINLAILGKVEVNNPSADIPLANEDSYLGWMSANASGTRGWNRFSHWYHGDSGVERARELLEVTNNPNSTCKQILEQLQKANGESSNNKHSLSRYLFSQLNGHSFADLATLSEDDFNGIKLNLI
jgi:hypothetical protein